MSFRDFEQSRYKAKPVNLFQFRYGSAINAVAAYTDAEQAITWGATVPETYLHEPITIDIGKINESGTLDRKQLEVKVPITTEIARQFAGYPPSYPVGVKMFQGHLTDGENVQFLAFWVGRVIAAKNDDDNQTTLMCEPITTSLTRVGLRRKYQYICPHQLYAQGDFLCNANKAAATLSITPIVGSIQSNSFLLPSGWASAPVIEQFKNGIVEWTTDTGTEIRTIRKLVAEGPNTRVKMDGPTRDLLTQQVRLSKGCNHQESHCSTIHNNINNFGGDPWIPDGQPLSSNKSFF